MKAIPTQERVLDDLLELNPRSDYCLPSATLLKGRKPLFVHQSL